MDNQIELLEDELNEISKFNVQVYGELEKFSDVISKSRVRIFYRGLNRNRSYISDEFAQKLIDTLPYSPVKGIFSSEELDELVTIIDEKLGTAHRGKKIKCSTKGCLFLALTYYSCYVQKLSICCRSC